MKQSKMSLRILYSFGMELGKGGVGTAALEQIKSLISSGCTVEVICSASSVLINGAELIETQRFFGQKLPQRAIGQRRALRIHDMLTARHLRNAAVKPDVVHTWPLAGELTLREASRLGILGVREAPNTHTGHAYEVVAREHQALGVPQSGSHAPNRAGLAVEEREYACADVILAPSDLAIETFVERGIPRSKLALKPYGFDPLKYPATDKSGRSGPITFSFIATCEPRKGLHLALDAWHKSGVADRTRLLVLGTFAPGYREILERQLGHPNVKLLGFVSDLAPIYQETDVLVLPSIEEGSALVTYEAQGAGCALLVSQAAGARMVDGEHGYLHIPGDVDTLARQMRELADDLVRLRAFQRAAAEHARGLTWSAATRELIATYRQALQRKHVGTLAAQVSRREACRAPADILTVRTRGELS